MQTSNAFGRDRFQYIAGDRYRVASGQTIRPLQGETNSLFEQRMDHIAHEFTKLPDVRSVDLEFEWRHGRIVECLIMISHDPELAPIEPDSRAAGGRIEPRGKRAA